MNVTPKTNILDGLSELSIAKAQKSVENIKSWEDAAAHAKRRIKELQQSLRVFEGKVKRGEPWPGTQSQGQESEQQHGV
ncbi:MAG TPA: hypothetical protein VK828_09535 [Terriglobales bacterium]|jgi:hypothetical protein|nr:hypothetical protein [Terriglobales bacterium]